MFFSNELLSRRDSGFGLLWLAATLGAKSSFKKLPRRSVLTADIAQLCGLISQPSEPLALRLSSNLMVGVVRVYKVKQELFMADVQTCFTSLKKAVLDFQTRPDAVLTELQMGQPTGRRDALTLHADPGASFSLELGMDALIADWDELLLRQQAAAQPASEDGDNGEYGVAQRGRRARGRARGHARSPSLAEQARGGARPQHLLNESYEQLLADSSLDGVPSSSLAGGADDALFGPVGELDLASMEDLAQALGLDLPVPSPFAEERRAEGAPGDTTGMITGLDAGPIDMGMEAFDFGEAPVPSPVEPGSSPSRKRPSPALAEETAGAAEADVAPQPPKKKQRRSKPVLDVRTELTDDELKDARANYVEHQNEVRREIDKKKAERVNAKMLEDLIWGPPPGLHDPGLVNFWMDNFNVQVEARLAGPGDRRAPAVSRISPTRRTDQNHAQAVPPFDVGGLDFDVPPAQEDFTIEEPEVGRFGSRPPSAMRSMAQYGRSPLAGSAAGAGWDTFGASSSVGDVFPPVAPGALEPADIRLRAPSLGSSRDRSRRESSIARELFGTSADLSLGMPSTQALAADFGFGVPSGGAVPESQQSDANLAELEHTSLEYAKDQLRSLPAAGSLTFEDIAPATIATAHVASSVFYHCLVLATKDLVQVDQPGPYATITITKK